MRYYCAPRGKTIYCDKSLDSAGSLAPFDRACPEALYLLQFRHVMDVIASGLEASPWGFARFGYLPYVQQSPDNLVAALAAHWLATVSTLLAWEERHPGRCYRVGYESLVTDPAPTVSGVLRFLGAAPVPIDFAQVLSEARAAPGPGDHKVAFTRQIASISIGRGKRVPVEMLPENLRRDLNGALTALGYETISDSWNVEPGIDISGAGRPGLVLERLIAGVAERLAREPRTGPVFAVIAEDDPSLRWVIDPAEGTTGQGDGEVDAAIIGRAVDLVALIRGDANAGALVRAGRVRQLQASRALEGYANPTVLLCAIAEILGPIELDLSEGLDPVGNGPSG